MRKKTNTKKPAVYMFTPEEVEHFRAALSGFDCLVMQGEDGIHVMTGDPYKESCRVGHVVIQKDAKAADRFIDDDNFTVPVIEHVVVLDVSRNNGNSYPFLDATEGSTILSFVIEILCGEEMSEIDLRAKSAEKLVREYVVDLIEGNDINTWWLDDFKLLLRYRVIDPTRLQKELAVAGERERAAMEKRIAGSVSLIEQLIASTKKKKK
jgi:hypothetical protein